MWNADGSVTKCASALITPQFFLVPSACIGNKASVRDVNRRWALWASTPDGTVWSFNTASEVDTIVSIGNSLAVGRLREPLPNAVTPANGKPTLSPNDIGATPLRTGEGVWVEGFGVGPGYSTGCLNMYADSATAGACTTCAVKDTWGNIHTGPAPLNDVYRERGAVAFSASDWTLRAIATGPSASAWVDVTAMREQIFSAIRSLDAGFERGVDRPGFDLPGSPITTDHAITCRNACERNANCSAFSFVRTTHQCWLKSTLAAPKVVSWSPDFNRPNVTSGVPRERGAFSISSFSWF